MAWRWAYFWDEHYDGIPTMVDDVVFSSWVPDRAIIKHRPKDAYYFCLKS